MALNPGLFWNILLYTNEDTLEVQASGRNLDASSHFTKAPWPWRRLPHKRVECPAAVTPQEVNDFVAQCQGQQHM
jgi:hypothetical protein